MINKAIIYIAEKEQGKFNKYSGKPRILHTLKVINVINKMSDNEYIVVAAALYSAMENNNISVDEIRENFGDRVADLIVPKNYNKSWVERKDDIIEYLYNKANIAQKKIILANELVEIREIEDYYDIIKEQLREHFEVNDEEQIGSRYMNLVDAFVGTEKYSSYEEYKAITYNLFKEKTFLEKLKQFLDVDGSYWYS